MSGYFSLGAPETSSLVSSYKTGLVQMFLVLCVVEILSL